MEGGGRSGESVIECEKGKRHASAPGCSAVTVARNVDPAGINNYVVSHVPIVAGTAVIL